MRSFVNLLIVMAVYFAGVSANTGDKAVKVEKKPDGKIVLKDGRVVYKEAKFAKPLKSGLIPDVVVKDKAGEDIRIRELAAQSPLLMIVYRGGWCPYCNRQLSGLQKIEAKIKEKGYRIVALSADRPSKIKKALEEKKFTYDLYSDSSMQASIALGLAFQVPESLVKTYKEKYSIDLEDASGEKHHYLPVPAVYVVSKEGKIKFAHAEADYKVRLSNDEVLAALE
ncbi:MAG: peroxiredoxin-like family protein [Pseudomonadota bacterium]